MYFIPLYPLYYLFHEIIYILMYFIETHQLGLEPESARKDKLQTRSSSKKLPVCALNKLLKTQAGDISPYIYKNSLRLHVSNIRAKFYCHCQGTSKNN